jgi:hypothetical protein
MYVIISGIPPYIVVLQEEAWGAAARKSAHKSESYNRLDYPLVPNPVLLLA